MAHVDYRWQEKVQPPRAQGMTTPLERWTGAFGDEYTTRNTVKWWDRVGPWQSILGDLRFSRVLEVGAGVGGNLLALRQLGYDAEGFEPNEAARVRARNVYIADGALPNLPTGPTSSYGLAFTCGVLIHIPPEEIPAAMAEMYRVSSKYLLAIEYYWPTPVEVPYRGESGLLWKRDFGRAYLEQFPDLRLIRCGWLTKAEGFDDCMFWLMEKP